ncbi:hypothetical protein JJQ72_20015 [Paenibacillus sp. F411]|nr:hypothetical protein [Paenibacillus sp. F411]MBO2946244.1 hypothetical protein [Paenibacillus sp. F411]
MLELINITDECRVTIEFDDYVPLNVEWKHSQGRYNLPLIYWRTGDIRKSLIEIGIDSISGVVCSMTLVLSSDNSKRNDILDMGEVMRGCPVFDISSFNVKYIDYVQSFSVIVLNNAVLINFSDEVAFRNVGNNDVVFSFDKEDRLQSITVCNLSKEDHAKIKRTLNID